MVAKTSGEECGVSDGEYLGWAQMEWTLKGASKMDTITTEGLCLRHSELVLFTSPFYQQTACMDHCFKLQRGTGTPVTSEKERAELLDMLTRVMINPATGNVRANIDGMSAWLPITDEQEEGVWVDSVTGQVPQNPSWLPGYPIPSTSENCGILVVTWGGWSNWACSDSQPISCACKFASKPYLTLRGLCKDSNLERRYLPINDPADGQLIYYGLLKSRIDYAGRRWSLRAANTTATSKATKGSFIVGKYAWTVENDSYECNEGKPYQVQLKLTGCREGEFTCDDGQCVRMEERCDQVVQCKDQSDEIGCQLLKLNLNYNKKVPPTTTASRTNFTVIPVPVFISITLMKIVSIKEVEHRITLQFEIILEWAEVRAIYQNLKRKSSLNALSNQDIEELWLPYAIFYNTDDKEATRLMEDVDTTLVISRQGDFVRSGLEFTDEVEVFEGGQNKITLRQTHSKEFQCKYKLNNYPFDTQVCSIKIVTRNLDKDMVNLQTKYVVMEEELELTMYIIQKWMLVRDDASSIKFIIVLERRFMSELLSTYLPSVLLLGISFATVFFKAEYFEAALTVNLTNMLVLTTIFISEMQTLPQTAYIKHIDIWLIFCQLIPFFEVLLITAAESLRKPDASGRIKSNHHGKIKTIQALSPPPQDAEDSIMAALKDKADDGFSTRDRILFLRKLTPL